MVAVSFLHGQNTINKRWEDGGFVPYWVWTGRIYVQTKPSDMQMRIENIADVAIDAYVRRTGREPTAAVKRRLRHAAECAAKAQAPYDSVMFEYGMYDRYPDGWQIETVQCYDITQVAEQARDGWVTLDRIPDECLRGLARWHYVTKTAPMATEMEALLSSRGLWPPQAQAGKSNAQKQEEGASCTCKHNGTRGRHRNDCPAGK